MTFDTHAAYKELIDGGFNDVQASAILKIVSKQGDALVTNADLKTAKSELLAALSKLRSEMVVWQVGIALALYGALRLTH